MSKEVSPKESLFLLVKMLAAVSAASAIIFIAVKLFAIFPYSFPILYGASLLWICLHLYVEWRSEQPRFSRPTGWKLRRFADFCFSKKTFTQVLEPILSDMQLEHIEALAAGRPWKARMVLVRGYYSFWSAVVAQLPLSLVRQVYEIWKSTKIGS